ncbi:glycoside hydrolase family 3 N-terminal domain-containing protein [Dysgonomonas sp. GY617]|uniref:glycoside hydrolase family 3 N-terminal domain-containing protein n=1 Tax=Dysgonomonas sp. GY617 TaxID=2780420 RepID=UPI001884142B|nr:glycoside hydrolase family 3 N-terminal domain-containing protein [Dysgonomonas sp. GY617]MBF0575371.1 glycoside hydrolase family 3 C-terminal domain-containing protein [Dysgonomonas sp. GY617]
MKYTLLLLCIALSLGHTYAQPKYKNPKLSAEERTKDLVSRMTLEEKVGQLLCPLGWEMYEIKGDKVTQSKKFEDIVKERQIGMLWATFRADPWTQKTLENGLNPTLAAEAGNALQKYIIENTRLGIPIFLAEECPHGHMAIGTTVFPTAIGQAATWNPELLTKMSSTIAQEARLQGSHIGYGPVLDLAREPRWSRTEETYGEDPILIARMGEAFVKGFGRGDLTKENSLISTLKHFVAYGVPEGGHNGNPNSVGMRDLRENYLPPFQAAVKAGALSVMTAYNSIDGIPCTSYEYLLKDVLRKEWGFNGFTVSDLGSIEGLKGSHHVVDNIQDAAILSANAGLDVDLGGNAFFLLIDAVKNNKVKESVIDEAVRHVLRLKFAMGLFENPYVDVKQVATNIRNQEHIDLARKVAQESVTLLKNEKNILPLNKNIKKVAVIGPNADNIYNQLGDYTAPQERDNIKTVLDGIKSKLNASQIQYVKGTAIRDTTNLEIQEAVVAAKNADVAIVVVGGSSARDFKTKYIDTGAAVASKDNISDMESGEGYDRVSLDLMGKQLDLLKAIKATSTPVIVVYIEGRPLNMNWADENANALLTAWYPGQEGGNAIADILFGDYNPAGRLPISVPRSVGQLPVYYNQRNPKSHDYVEMTQAPLYPFGFGLSYTSFEYSNLAIRKVNNTSYTAEFTITNTGNFDGDEVAQLYIRDEVASTVRPVKQLKHFSRINLKKGESKTVSFELSKNDFSIIDQQMKQIVEPGKFKIMIGSSSEDIKLEDVVNIETI